ncbi:MAG: DUF4160 domain-containing protein [Caldilineaceae bacterium]|nr:DUF4160 domain-containing protein [Caldilineaceae bacterium]
MTEISRFFGIIIRMYPEGGMYHHRPHFHATYQGVTVSYSIEPIEPIRGQFSPRQRRLVEAWIELHQDELLENWRLLSSGYAPHKIDPLHK